MFRKKAARDEKAHGGQGGDTLEELSRQLRESSPNGNRIEPFNEGLLMENLHLANALYDRNRPGEPASQRGILAPLFLAVKRVVRWLVSWYVVPSVENQALFNAYMTRTVNEMKHYLDHLQINEDILSTIMHRDLALFRANILYLNRYLERRMLDMENELTLLRNRGAAPLAAGDNGDGDGDDILSSLDVLTLEQRIHGTPRMVSDRQRSYIQYFRGCRNVLAVGCGRGELLQLLAGEGITAIGTETNATLVSYCRDNGLDVSRVDPIEYVESLDDASLDGVVLSRFAGHQPPGRLIRMLEACRRKLAEGAVMVIETPNPFSLYAAASYALDDSERAHPLHPETLRLLCVSYGFEEPTVMFLNPLPPEEHLEELDLGAGGPLLDPRQQELFQQANQNFAKINRILFSHRDYALLARRGSGESS